MRDRRVIRQQRKLAEGFLDRRQRADRLLVAVVEVRVLMSASERLGVPQEAYSLPLILKKKLRKSQLPLTPSEWLTNGLPLC